MLVTVDDGYVSSKDRIIVQKVVRDLVTGYRSVGVAIDVNR